MPVISSELVEQAMTLIEGRRFSVFLGVLAVRCENQRIDVMASGDKDAAGYLLDEGKLLEESAKFLAQIEATSVKRDPGL